MSGVTREGSPIFYKNNCQNVWRFQKKIIIFVLKYKKDDSLLLYKNNLKKIAEIF